MVSFMTTSVSLESDGECLSYQWRGWPQTAEHNVTPKPKEKQLPTCHSEVEITSGHTQVHTHMSMCAKAPTNSRPLYSAIPKLAEKFKI